MKHRPSPLDSLRRPLLVGASLLGLTAASSPAQLPPDPEPVRNAIVFTLRISGSGSDPAPTGNTGNLAAAQDWTYDRTIDGWFEVDVTRRREGMGAAARELVEFSRKRNGRHQIVGGVSDSVRNFERGIGEGFGLGHYADYTVSETAEWRGAIDPGDGPGVVLDATNKVWVGMFDPQAMIGDYRPMMDFRAEAKFAPSSDGAGFGEPWTYTTDDLSTRLAGDKKQIVARYYPGDRGFTAVFPEKVRSNVPARFDGTVATGRVEYEVPRPDYAQGTWKKMHYVVDWAARTELPDVELEVRCPDYETWRPTATEGSAAPGSGRAYGEGLNFAAQLRRVDGNKTAPLPKIRALEWRLSDTSREPGIAMNFPYKSDDRRLDMEIVAGDLTEPEDATAQAVVVRAPGDPINEATVFPYDWGGWTTLRVTATLDDGRRIEGILRGGAKANGLKAIRVPATTPGSKIAWGWLREFYPEWQSDADDEDKIPAGKPGADGDGFSVYEEYRGFYGHLGTHFSTLPQRKDLFVRVDEFNQKTAGVFRFFAISGLERRFLRRDQLPRAGANERVVNCNVGAGATCGPQAAVPLHRAERLALQWLDAHPDDPEGAVLMADVMAAQEDKPQAIAYTYRALAADQRQRPPGDVAAIEASLALRSRVRAFDAMPDERHAVLTPALRTAVKEVRAGKLPPAPAATMTPPAVKSSPTAPAAAASAPTPPPAVAPSSPPPGTSPSALFGPTRRGEPSPGQVVPAAELVDAKIRADAAGQWAASARAGSEYGRTQYSAARATGAPNVPIVGNSPDAWCPASKDKGSDWLEVTFVKPVRATEIRIRQNDAAGAIAKVEAIEPDGTAHLWWEGADPLVAPAVRDIAWFAVRVPKTDYLVVKMKITLNLASGPGWKQIDAVQLVAADGQKP